MCFGSGNFEQKNPLIPASSKERGGCRGRVGMVWGEGEGVGRVATELAA